MTYLSHIGTQTKLWASAECTGEDKPGLFITDHLSSLWISTSFWKQLYLKANVIYFVKSRFFPESRTAPQCSNRTLVSNCWNVVRDENKSGVISPQLISEQWETRSRGWSRNQQLLWRDCSCFFDIFPLVSAHQWWRASLDCTASVRGVGGGAGMTMGEMVTGTETVAASGLVFSKKASSAWRTTRMLRMVFNLS